MRSKLMPVLAVGLSLLFVRVLSAQDLGPQIKKIKDGIYVYVGKEFNIPGHGTPGTVKIFEDSDRYYALLLERVGKMTREGKSLDEIKKELRMPEYDSWASKDRIPSNIEAAYKVVKGN